MCLASQKVIFDFRRTFWIALLNTRNDTVCQQKHPFSCRMTQKLFVLTVILLIPVQLLEIIIVCHADCLRNVVTRHRLLNVSPAAVYPGLNSSNCSISTKMKQRSRRVRACCHCCLLIGNVEFAVCRGVSITTPF